MNKELLKQSISIFDTQDKWNALFEIHNQNNEIIDYWLTIGARALRDNFAGDLLWGCEKWGYERDTRWYLKEFGTESLGIGFGWIEVELHLHLKDSQSYDYKRASELLSHTSFMPLLDLFELKTPPKHVVDGGLAYNDTINPFSGATDTQIRQRELAWLAANKTKEYVEKMGGIIRRLTADDIHTGLFRELNLKSMKAVGV
jgi:hypothetical protein